MASLVLNVEDDIFNSEIIESEKPVVVDFWAPWCGPCKAIGPIIDELASKFKNEIKFAKCNVDKNPTISANYGIKAIPTLIFFKNGKVVDKVTGIVSKIKLEEVIATILA